MSRKLKDRNGKNATIYIKAENYFQVKSMADDCGLEYFCTEVNGKTSMYEFRFVKADVEGLFKFLTNIPNDMFVHRAVIG